MQTGLENSRALTCTDDAVWQRHSDGRFGAPAAQPAAQQVAPRLLDGQRGRLERVLALAKLLEAQLKPPVDLELIVEQSVRQLDNEHHRSR